MKNTLHKGPFPLHMKRNDDHFVIVTNQGNHYAKTFDPSAARLIASAPDLLSALEFLLADYIAINGENLTGSSVPADKAREALRKAKGEA